MTTVRAALAEAARRLGGAGVEDAQREAAWLLAHVLATTAGGLRAQGGLELDPVSVREFADLVERRVAREPIQYILGTEEFMGITFRVSPAVLIPRLDTEVLVRETAARLSGPIHIADIGTGSGAIAVGLATLLPQATVVAVDISASALEVAATNAARAGVADRVEFRHGDLLEPLAGETFAAIVSNPPYIPEGDMPGLMPEVRQWEPNIALVAGPDGLDVYRRLAAGVTRHLSPGGFLAVEVGFGQATQVAGLLAAVGLAVDTRLDSAGIQRVVIGQRAK